MAAVDTVDTHHHGDAHDAHGHDHGHGEFIQHHFDSAEQQFDSAKLGMWLFLAQEILFFSGLFVAYTLFRYHNPQVFEDAHIFLDKTLGGLNTIVLLFSSLTMAWAVRCSQLEQHRGTVINIVITMVCAFIFLGVKAVEYSHKWEIGLLWANEFQPFLPKHGAEVGYLSYLVVPVVIVFVLLIAIAVFSKVTDSNFEFAFFGCLALTVCGYFLGVGIGMALPVVKPMVGIEHIDSHEVLKERLGISHDEHDDHKGHDDHGDKKAEAHARNSTIRDSRVALSPAADLTLASYDDKSKDKEASDESKSKKSDAAKAEEPAPGGVADQPQTEEGRIRKNVGVFFSIYYVMTGLHALHIFAGIIALAWLLYRSLLKHFRKDYFGPVENVGLYWHLVDLIWIYLFPMLYLLGRF